jgi:uncharacterized protein YfaT (DUF1175 family)
MDYTERHPDHVSAEWERGGPGEVGAVVVAIERIAGRREVVRSEVTHIDPPNRIVYRARGAHALLIPCGEHTIVAEGSGSTFTASLRNRFGAVAELAFRKRAAALRTHMREEAEGLRRLVEGAS